MSQDIGMTSNLRFRVRGFPFAGWARGAGGQAWGSSGGLVVAVWVEDQFAQEFAGGGVDDADVQVLDQEQDVGPGVGCPLREPTRRTRRTTW